MAKGTKVEEVEVGLGGKFFCLKCGWQMQVDREERTMECSNRKCSKAGEVLNMPTIVLEVVKKAPEGGE